MLKQIVFTAAIVMTLSAPSLAADAPGYPYPDNAHPLIDNGGYLMTAHPINPIVILWGTGFASDFQTGINDFLFNLMSDGSPSAPPLWRVMSQYGRGAKFMFGLPQTGGGFKPPTFYNDTVNPPPTDDPGYNTMELQAEINNLINAGKIPEVKGGTNTDVNMYFLLTSNAYPQTGYCGFHSLLYRAHNGYHYPAIFIPNLAELANCTIVNYSYNSYSAVVQDTVHIVEHEVTESVTDRNWPQTWVDSEGNEIADKCMWDLVHSVTLGSTTWNLQPLYDNSIADCSYQLGVHP